MKFGTEQELEDRVVILGEYIIEYTDITICP